MFRKIIYRLLAVRHPWRYIGFDELGELYASMMLRSTGLSLIGIFVPIYLYKLDYALSIVCLFMAGVFVARMVFDVVAGYMVAWWGPKHTMLWSYIVQIITLIMLLTLPQYSWPLWLVALMWGISLSMFFVAYNVDFSKIMHQAHGGKELGFMTIMERLGAALGPLIGGAIASFIGAEYTIIAAIILFVLAVIPLFMTAEPTALRQRVHFRGLPYRKLYKDFTSFAALGADNSVSVAIWPLFIGVTIFTVNTYATVGLVTSLGILVSIMTAHLIGQVVDRNKGGVLLRWAALGNSILHLVRTTIQSFGGVLVTNISNEAVTSGYKLPYLKGMYARAESLPGFRIAYIVCMEVIGDAGKALAWFAIWALCFFVDPVSALWWSFILVAPVSLLISYQNFPALKASKF